MRSLRCSNRASPTAARRLTEDGARHGGTDPLAAELEATLPPAHELVVPSRTVRLPLSWDDPATREAIQRYMHGVRADAPWKTWKDFVAYAKANPKKLNYGSSGNYGTMHVPMEILAQTAGFKLSQRRIGDIQAEIATGSRSREDMDQMPVVGVDPG